MDQRSDRMFVNSGGINAPYARMVEINNLYAPTTRENIDVTGTLVLTNSIWGGNVNIKGGYRSVVDNVEFSRQGGYANCGQISLVGSIAAIVRNVRFQYPNGWAIDNTQTKQIPECPIIENVAIYTTSANKAALQRNEESGANNRYRRAIPSYIADGTSWTIIN